jgi:hypothetical protein
MGQPVTRPKDLIQESSTRLSSPQTFGESSALMKKDDTTKVVFRRNGISEVDIDLHAFAYVVLERPTHNFKLRMRVPWVLDPSPIIGFTTNNTNEISGEIQLPGDMALALMRKQYELSAYGN